MKKHKFLTLTLTISWEIVRSAT